MMDLGKILFHHVYKPYTLCPSCYRNIGSQKAGVYVSALPQALCALMRTDIYSRFWRPNKSIENPKTHVM